MMVDGTPLPGCPDYEEIATANGGYKRRKKGAVGWRYICAHKKERTQCRECSGSSFCSHGKRRATCKECDGASVCPHNRQRYQCRECIEATKAGK